MPDQSSDSRQPTEKTGVDPAKRDKITPSSSHRAKLKNTAIKLRSSKEEGYLNSDELEAVNAGASKENSIAEIFSMLDTAKQKLSESGLDKSEFAQHPLFLEFGSAAQDAPCLTESNEVEEIDPVIAAIRAHNKPKWGKPHRNPVQFIKDNYSDELAQGILKRNMLVHLDDTLAAAYATWIRPDRHPEDSLWPDVDGKLRMATKGLSVEERLERRLSQNADSQQRYKDSVKRQMR